MKESSKALRRRWCEHATGFFPWRDLFRGAILDVGAGDDPLPFDGVTPFDKKDGDANLLPSYFKPKSFDLIHASQCLEHLHDPARRLSEWLTLVRPGGHIVVTVPDLLYEGFGWPSRYNDDHKSTWSMIYRGSPAPLHIHIPTMLAQLPCEIVMARFVDTNFDYTRWTSFDQTLDESDGVEVFNEFVLRS